MLSTINDCRLMKSTTVLHKKACVIAHRPHIKVRMRWRGRTYCCMCSNTIDVNLKNVYMYATTSLLVNPTTPTSQLHMPWFEWYCYRFAARSMLSSTHCLSSHTCINGQWLKIRWNMWLKYEQQNRCVGQYIFLEKCRRRWNDKFEIKSDVFSPIYRIGPTTL